MMYNDSGLCKVLEDGEWMEDYLCQIIVDCFNTEQLLFLTAEKRDIKCNI